MSFVANLGESSVDLTARGWTNTADFWAAFWDLSRRSKTELEAAGFSIPFPQRDLHIKEGVETAPTAASAKAAPAKSAPAKKPAARSTAAKPATKAAAAKKPATSKSTTTKS